MSDQEVQSSQAARPPKMIRLKVAAWTVLVLVAVLAVVWFGKSIVCAGAVRAKAEDAAQGIAGAIAAFGNEDIVARDYRSLQAYSDNLVRHRPIASVAIVDSRDRVVVHTNREFLGRSARDLTKTSGVVEASAQVMDLTKQAGTVVVGVRID